MRIYANLIGNWVDITEDGTVADGKNPILYFKETLSFLENSTVAECFKYGYIHVQYHGHDYCIHPSMIQFIDY